MSTFPLALPEFVRFYETFPGFPFDVEPALGARPFLASLPPPPGPNPSICTVGEIMINGGQGGCANLRVLVVKPVGLPSGEVSSTSFSSSSRTTLLLIDSIDRCFYFLALSCYLGDSWWRWSDGGS